MDGINTKRRSGVNGATGSADGVPGSHHRPTTCVHTAMMCANVPAAACPCRLRGVPTPTSVRMKRPKLKPPTWTATLSGCSRAPAGACGASRRSQRNAPSSPFVSVHIKGWSNLQSFAWTADGKGLFVTVLVRGGRDLLLVDLQGNSQLLWENLGGSGETLAVASPDGRHLAFNGWTTDGNFVDDGELLRVSGQVEDIPTD